MSECEPGLDFGCQQPVYEITVSETGLNHGVGVWTVKKPIFCQEVWTFINNMKGHILWRVILDILIWMNGIKHLSFKSICSTIYVLNTVSNVHIIKMNDYHGFQCYLYKKILFVSSVYFKVEF